MAIKKSDSSGIPFGNNAGRPAPAIGRLYSNGEEKRLELYTSSGWQNIVSETPGVVSVSGSYLESVGSATLEITGTNFTTGAIASVIGTNGVEVNANSTTVNSIVSVTAVFSGLSNANEPYDLKITNTSNLFGLLPDALYVNANPVWQTASGSLGTFAEQVAMSVSATATDDSTITYSFWSLLYGFVISISFSLYVVYAFIIYLLILLVQNQLNLVITNLIHLIYYTALFVYLLSLTFPNVCNCL